MKLVKKRKMLQIFSNGSLNFCYNNFFYPKDNQFIFYEKDFKNFHFYIKKYDQQLTITDTENLVYRKKYVDIKN